MAKNTDALMTALRYKKQEKAIQPQERTFVFKQGELGDRPAIGQEVDVLLTGRVKGINPDGTIQFVVEAVGEKKEEPEMVRLETTPAP